MSNCSHSSSVHGGLRREEENELERKFKILKEKSLS